MAKKELIPKVEEEILDEELEETEEDLEEEDEENEEIEENNEGDTEKNEEYSDNKEEEGDKEKEESKEGKDSQLKPDASVEYKSNYKYKVKGEEYDVDDFFKPFIKDKESEAKVIDLLTRAKGLEEVSKTKEYLKSERDKITEEYTEFRKKFAPSVELYEKGHKLESMLALFSADDLMYAAKEIERYNQLDDRERRHFENSMRTNYELYNKSKAYDQDSEALNREIRKNTDLEINQTIHFDPEIKEVADWYDSVYGKGEFKKEVHNYGTICYNNGKVIPPQESVNYIFEKIGKMKKHATPISSSNSTASTTPIKTIQSINEASRKDKIPNLKSSGSIVRKTTKPKSFKEAIEQAKEEEGFDEEE